MPRGNTPAPPAGAAETTPRDRAASTYVVLQLVDSATAEHLGVVNDGGHELYCVAARGAAGPSAEKAIDKALPQDAAGTFIGVPSKSWKPVPLESVTTVVRRRVASTEPEPS